VAIERIDLPTARKHAKLTQAGLAKICGVSVSTVANWEHGKSEPTVSQARMIGAACGVHYDDIIFLTSDTVLP
jgi:transcriptional regulator with XRE-family HTH domain